MRGLRRRRRLALAVIGIVAALTFAVYAEGQSAVYLLVLDKQNVPVLDIKPLDIRIAEDAGPGTVASIGRYGWPLKLTVLVDNGPGTADGLVHLRNGLNRLFEGIPRDIQVSLIATAPNPRWLIRESKDPVRGRLRCDI